MKNKGIYLLNLAVVLVLTCSFVPSASPVENNNAVGGAYLVFAGKFGGEITKAEIAGHTSLKVDGCARGSRIFEYTIAITKGGKTTILSHKSNDLTNDMVTRLNNLSNGDTFEFSNTKAYLPDGKDKVDVHSRKFVVVEKV